MGFFAITEELIAVNMDVELRRRIRFLKTAELIHCETRMIHQDSIGKIIPLDLQNIFTMESQPEIDYTEVIEPSRRAIRFAIQKMFLNTEKRSHNTLCFGVLNGALLNFLVPQMNVALVEQDTTYLASVFMFFANRFYGSVKTYAVDPNEIPQFYYTRPTEASVKLKNFRRDWDDGRFDLIAVDVRDIGYRLHSPRKDMTTPTGIEMMKSMVTDDGLVLVRVIPTDFVSDSHIISNMKLAFPHVFKIKIKKEKEYLLVGCTVWGNVDQGDEKMPAEFQVEKV
ncbi:hypothetical protein QVD17_36277 [Tagetes erecta]|uniref:Uncharacterized protein n=1 Tax=Tagetes erecta TaxID=13708 RepID=A0AAD8JTU2_TARER|nr:hypothetical protein QVD17_36277 [Tagetes erecta]